MSSGTIASSDPDQGPDSHIALPGRQRLVPSRALSTQSIHGEEELVHGAWQALLFLDGGAYGEAYVLFDGLGGFNGSPCNGF